MHVLLVGPTDEPLFSEIVSAVRAAECVSRVHTVRNLVELDRSLAPDLLLVLQRWPDEYPRQQILALIDTYRLARLLVCYGSWCDSDGRTRDLWPLVTRVPAPTAAPRLVQELESLRHRAPHLPLTADRTEAYPHTAALQDSTLTKRLSIAIVTPDRALSEHLRDVLTAAEHSPLTAGAAPLDLLLWDADPWDSSSRRELMHLCTMHPSVPVVALSGFPRLHQMRELQSAGVVTVIPKSADNASLVARLEQVPSVTLPTDANGGRTSPLHRRQSGA